jgi:hypothetical protein
VTGWGGANHPDWKNDGGTAGGLYDGVSFTWRGLLRPREDDDCLGWLEFIVTIGYGSLAPRRAVLQRLVSAAVCGMLVELPRRNRPREHREAG